MVTNMNMKDERHQALPEACGPIRDLGGRNIQASFLHYVAAVGVMQDVSKSFVPERPP